MDERSKFTTKDLLEVAEEELDFWEELFEEGWEREKGQVLRRYDLCSPQSLAAAAILVEALKRALPEQPSLRYLNFGTYMTIWGTRMVTSEIFQARSLEELRPSSFVLCFNPNNYILIGFKNSERKRFLPIGFVEGAAGYKEGSVCTLSNTVKAVSRLILTGVR